MVWQVQEAKQRFSALVQRALEDGPQTVTRRGEPVVVVISAAEYRRLTGSGDDFTAFLLNGPDLSLLDLDRRDDLARKVQL